MHEYYEKNLNKWNKTLTAYMNLIRSELNSITGQSYDVLVQEIWTDYQTHMLERFPYIGGDAASGTKNLTGAYMFVSMGEILKKYGVTTEQSGHLMILIYERQFKKIPSFLRRLMGKIFTNPGFLTKMFLKKDRQNALNAAQKKDMISVIITSFVHWQILQKNMDMKNMCLISAIWIMLCSVF